jgi:hypothetical protein
VNPQLRAAVQEEKASGRLHSKAKRLNHILTAGMTDSVRNDLLSRLPVHEGDILSADSMERVRRIVREFDEHMNVGTILNPNGEVALVLSVPVRLRAE